MSEKKKTTVSRRNFIKTAAVGAVAVAGVAKTAGMASAYSSKAVTDGKAPIRRPPRFAQMLAAPLKKIDFPMNGAQVFAKVCKQDGLAGLFQCPGNYTVTHAIIEEGIPSWSGRHEGNTAHAADGFSRVTGEISACSGTEGPGFTDMICGVAEANAARSPMLVLASNMRIAGEDAEQRLQQSTPYQQPTTDGMKKYGKRLITADRVYEYGGFAFRALKNGVPKPVHIDFPSEVSGAKFKSAKELKCYFDKAEYRTDALAYPSPKHVEAAIDLLRKAKRPIIVGSTGVFYHKAWDPLRKLAERMQIPVTESGPSRGAFSDGHALSATISPGCYPSADVVMLVGQYCMPMVGGFAFGPDAKYIRIDPNSEDIGRNLPITVGIVSDERLAMEAMLDKAPSMRHDSWIAEVKAARKKFEDENKSWYAMAKNYSHAVHPAVIAQGLQDLTVNGSIPREYTTIVSGGYGIARYTRRFFRAYRPGQMLNGAYHYAAIGPDLGFAVGAGAAVQKGIGVQAPYKGNTVICVTGDAGFGYTAMEIETMALYSMPTVIVVWVNNAWGTYNTRYIGTRTEQIHLFQENLRYNMIADALGGAGEYVTTPQDFMPALERAYKLATAEKIPVLVSCQGDNAFWTDKAKYPPGKQGKVEPGCQAYYH